MNLQQLNKSGQNLWVFIVTGVVALLITGVSWLCVEVITSYRGWTKLGSTNDSHRNESLAFRLALLVWLVKNGHTTWMRCSGAWLCILSNDKLGNFSVVAANTTVAAMGTGDSPLETACDYVYRSILSQEKLVFDLDMIPKIHGRFWEILDKISCGLFHSFMPVF